MVEIITSIVKQVSPPYYPKSTLKPTRVEVVEILEIFSDYPATDSYKTGSHQI
jgi:hypothetical protein